MESFRTGSYLYANKFFEIQQQMSQTESFTYEALIPAGGYLRGVRMSCRGTGGVGGANAGGRVASYIITNAYLAHVDGGMILYPTSGDTTALTNYLWRPWEGNVQSSPGYNQTVPNFVFSVMYQTEIHSTAGVLSNQDARSLYKFGFTLGSGNTLFTVQPGTYPTFTITLYAESWATPDRLPKGIETAEKPPGLCLATISRSQVFQLPRAGSDATLQVANTGNYIRHLLVITRGSNGALLTGVVGAYAKLRIGDRDLGTFTVNELNNQFADFYQAVGVAQLGLFSGCTLTFPRFYNRNTDYGSSWLRTERDSLLTVEFDVAVSGATAELVTHEVIPVGPMRDEFINI